MNGHGGRADEPFPTWAAVDAAITDGAETAFSFLERLVAAPSTVGHEQEAQDVVAAELAHEAAHGTAPPRGVLGATTDARFYLNQFGRPALCYGPASRNIHAIDEAVELASIVSGARTLARFIAGFFAMGVRP